MIKESSFNKFKYLLYEPSHLNNLENLPLIVVMHGSGEIGSSLSKLKAREPYISLNNGKFKTDAYVLMPQLPKNTWGSMAADLVKLATTIADTYKCDKERISLTGHSLGAMGVIEIMSKYPNTFSAGASLSCAHNYTSYMPKLANIPIWFLHGAKESNYGKYAREMFGVLDKLNEECKLTSIPGYGHPIQPFWCNSKYGILIGLHNIKIGELKMPTWGEWLMKQKLVDGKGNLTIKVDETIAAEDGEKFNIRRVDIKMDYDYHANMYSDIKDYIATEGINLSGYENIEEANEALYDILFEESSITGNGPNNYYASQYACESYLCHNFDLAREACINFCVDAQTLLDHLEKEDLPEFFDCTIRCYLLGEVLGEVLSEYFK